MRREFLKTLGAGIVAAAAGRPAWAQSWPSKPIIIVFPYGAGGVAGGIAQAVAQYMKTQLNTPVIVEFKPGANTAIGTEFVASAPADGHTLLWTSGSTLSTNPILYKGLRYKPEQFEPITSVFSGPLGLCVRKDIPAQNFRQLVEYAKRNGNKLEYGAAGQGSSPHLLMTAACKQAGVQPSLIAYKGEPAGISDVIGGHLPVFVGALPNMVQHHKSHALRIIAVSSPRRLPNYPDLPTFAEVGFPEVEYMFWHGVWAPAGTPQPVIERLRTTLHEAMATPAVKALIPPDQSVVVGSGDDVRRWVAQDARKWGAVIRDNNIVAE
jgi:tripartite-type tricarboxylate transporter receptor subunit TctC